MKAKIKIDPITPEGFYTTPHEQRSRKELDEWWGIPFIVTLESGPYFAGYKVLCLDGGAWDRPSMIGHFHSLEDAQRFAHKMLGV
jgi:hypothetical protein